MCVMRCASRDVILGRIPGSSTTDIPTNIPTTTTTNNNNNNKKKNRNHNNSKVHLPTRRHGPGEQHHASV